MNNTEKVTDPVMTEAFICDYIRTPIGRFGGALAQVRTDDLGAVPLKALMERNAAVDWEAVDDLHYGCANQAGEDNRNVGRMAALLAGLQIGTWPDEASLPPLPGSHHRFEPCPILPRDLEEGYGRWQQAIQLIQSWQ